ncbi:hypothetical protein ACFE04_011712 [Oxalis oulophora]
MENGQEQKWSFGVNEALTSGSAITVRGVLNMLMSNINDKGDVVVPLGHGDPSAFPCFRTCVEAEDAIVHSLKSAFFNSYSSCYKKTGRMFMKYDLQDCYFPVAVADYLNNDLPDKLCPDDVYLTLGCTQAIEIVLTVLARPGANILLPRPGFPYYEAICGQRHLEFRHFDLLPEKGWEVDLTAIEALADAKTTAMVIINPGNPTGSVYSYQHLQKVAETAKKLGILVIADEVYGHLVFGDTPFTPMGVFSLTVPIITLGSISKRWIVPGWRIGWLITNDHHAILKDTGIVDSIKGFLNLSSDPATFIQGAIPRILENTKPEFFSKIIENTKPEFFSKIIGLLQEVKLNLSLLEDINDDVDFCLKLAKEQNTIVLPGVVLGMKNWLRITFAIDPSALSDGLERIKCFYEGQAKKR